MENPLDERGERVRRALARPRSERSAVLAWPIAAVLHGAALAAAAFVEIEIPARARAHASDDDDEVILMLDLRASSLYDLGGAEEELDGAPGEATEAAPAPEAAPVELAVAHGTDVGEEPPVESEPEPPPTEIVDAAPPAPTWPEDEPLAEIAVPQVIAPEVASVVGSQPVEAVAAVTQAPDESATASANSAAAAPVVADASMTASATGAATGDAAPAGGGGTGSAGAGRGPVKAGIGLDGGDVASVSRGELQTRFAPRPSYPARARRRGEQGSVLCRLIIDRDGRVVEVSVVTSSTFPDLDAAAVAALRRWRFEPIGRLTSASRARALQKLTFSLASARG